MINILLIVVLLKITDIKLLKANTIIKLQAFYKQADKN